MLRFTSGYLRGNKLGRFARETYVVCRCRATPFRARPRPRGVRKMSRSEKHPWRHFMARGGRRPGAGRKPGSGNKKRSEAILKREYASGDVMPLDLMLSEMRRLAKEGSDCGLREARALAQAAAPYCHPRLQAIDTRNTIEAGDTLSALLRMIDGSSTGIARGLAVSRPPLASQQPVFDPDEGGSEGSLSIELGANGSA